MATFTLNLSDGAISHLREEARARGFATAEEYLQHLVAEDLRLRDEKRLEAVLLQRLEDGRSVEMNDADFQRIAERAAARIAATSRPHEQWAIEFRAEIEAKNPPSVVQDLVTAAFEGDLARVKELLASGIPIDTRYGEFNTALHAAIENGQAHIVEFLLNAGADPNCEAYPGGTPLFHSIDVEGDAASQLEYREPADASITALLLRYGGDPTRKGPKGESLIEHARHYFHEEAMRLLQEAAAKARR